MSQELVHEIDSERDSTIQILKSKLNNFSSHYASSVAIAADTQEIATQLASNLEGDHSHQASVVSDDVIVKNNTVPYIYANEKNSNSYGDAFIQDHPTSYSEQSYQIKLLSAPKHNRLYVGEQANTEVVTMMLLILLVTIIAVILHLVVHEVEARSVTDDKKTYIIMAHANNNDPILREMRYMPIPEDRNSCTIM